MKKLTLTFAAVLFVLTAFAQKPDRYYIEQYFNGKKMITDTVNLYYKADTLAAEMQYIDVAGYVKYAKGFYVFTGFVPKGQPLSQNATEFTARLFRFGEAGNFIEVKVNELWEAREIQKSK